MSQSHHFGYGKFTKELWIAGKKIFPKVVEVDVEFETDVQWDWLIADINGNIIKTVTGGKASWSSLHLASHGLYGDYSIGFKSDISAVKSIKQGDVQYG
ncbi:hypothetical protein [Pantoea phytobeneficialis]|uniref:Uncharacterized protein n=1 Tax=Pantoea phytobeneficialis TaxID=2052056 RepID=A0AAP9H7D7_9GAMM|nr:hypothetical protein [Pantoea phytobeneficialis]MDO6408693.1 hypothetical protein [Pantoea phytobeneficialis]QGR08120.1 hypothetical protein CTZ24_17490 [Pantoea phytobeneficialis]